MLQIFLTKVPRPDAELNTLHLPDRSKAFTTVVLLTLYFLLNHLLNKLSPVLNSPDSIFSMISRFIISYLGNI